MRDAEPAITPTRSAATEPFGEVEPSVVAELFVLAEQMLIEVLGRIRPADLDIRLPAIAGVTGDAGSTLEQVVELHLRADAQAAGVLRGTPAEPVDSSGNRQAEVVRVAALAMSAAERADPTAVLPGGLPVAEYLLRLTVTRSLVAHYVAAYLGSTACPLPEELARPLWELTAPDAVAWRATGLFRTPMPVPERASWRDTFLRTAGHEPHPLGH